MDFEQLLVTIAKILDELGIPYFVTGGYAVSMWGRVRSTIDIDLVVELREDKISVLKHTLQKVSEISYIDEDVIKEALERRGEFNFIYPELGLKVDFFVRDDVFFRQQLKRLVKVKIRGYKVNFIGPEDLILSKLAWHKKGGSEKQREDIKSIIKIQEKLDWKYLKKWSKIQSTKEILESLIER